MNTQTITKEDLHERHTDHIRNKFAKHVEGHIRRQVFWKAERGKVSAWFHLDSLIDEALDTYKGLHVDSDVITLFGLMGGTIRKKRLKRNVINLVEKKYNNSIFVYYDKDKDELHIKW